MDVKLSFGVCSKSLLVQLDEQGFIYTGKENLENIRKSMNLLRFTDLLNDSGWHKMNEKLFKRIMKNIKLKDEK